MCSRKQKRITRKKKINKNLPIGEINIDKAI